MEYMPCYCILQLIPPFEETRADRHPFWTQLRARHSAPSAFVRPEITRLILLTLFFILK